MKKFMRFISIVLALTMVMSLVAYAAPATDENISTYANRRVATGRVIYEEDSFILTGLVAGAAASLFAARLNLTGYSNALVNIFAIAIGASADRVYYQCNFKEYSVYDSDGYFVYYEYEGKMQIYKDRYHTDPYGSGTTVKRQSLAPMSLPSVA